MISLREALQLYAEVEHALCSVDPGKIIPGPELARHECKPRECAFVGVLDKYFVCLYSCAMHHCTAETCDRLQETHDGLICPISGFSFESRPLLVAGDFAAFSGQQTLDKKHAPRSALSEGHDEQSALPEDDDAMQISSDAGPQLEEAKDSPFDSHRERMFARTQREHAARRRECDALLELLLFSEHRRKRNEWAEKHTRDKHVKGVANYMRNAQTDCVVFTHVWNIISLDRNETVWCINMPVRDSPAHLDCVRICEQACVWWNRFLAHNGGRPLPNYTFKYHVLAVLYIHATGMVAPSGEQLLVASPVLRSTLPGVETLRTFPGMLRGYYTSHERTCRERILAWVAANQNK